MPLVLSELRTVRLHARKDLVSAKGSFEEKIDYPGNGEPYADNLHLLLELELSHHR
jgi:hypothetical protein